MMLNVGNLAQLIHDTITQTEEDVYGTSSVSKIRYISGLHEVKDNVNEKTIFSNVEDIENSEAHAINQVEIKRFRSSSLLESRGIVTE